MIYILDVYEYICKSKTSGLKSICILNCSRYCQIIFQRGNNDEYSKL